MRRQILIALAFCGSLGPVAAREWTDASGKHHVEARLLQRQGDQVWLEKENAKLLIVPWAKLSGRDQAYIERELGQAAPGATREVRLVSQTAANSRPAEAPARPSAKLAQQRARAAFRYASFKQDPEAEATADSNLDGLEIPEEVQAAEELAAPEVLPEAEKNPSHEKFIYKGRCGTFHLIGDVGTGAYWYKGKQYLALLFKAGEDENYLYYDSNHPDGQIVQWYFSKSKRCCQFWVWKRTHDGHGHFEREKRETPN